MDIVSRVDDGVGTGFAVRAERSAYGKRIGSLRGDQAFVRGNHVDRGEIAVGDRHAVKNELHFRLIARFDAERAFFCGAGYVIRAVLCDIDGFTVLHRDLGRALHIGSLFEVSCSEDFIRIDLRGLGSRRRRFLRI